MALHISTAPATGLTLFATLERLSDGFFWNNVASEWQAAPSTANKKISLPEGTGANAGSYAASVTGLGDAGAVRVRIHDDTDAADATIGSGEVIVVGGNEVLDSLNTSVATLVTATDTLETSAGTLATAVGTLTDGVTLDPNQLIDGVALSTLLTELLALASGDVTPTDNGNGTYTLAFKRRDGTTNAFSITYNPTTGART